jgi:hypothetical protein
MKNNLPDEIMETKKELLKVLNLFDKENINTVPFEGSWTGGQVAEHVLKSASGVLETLNATVKPTGRNPEENVKQLGDIFLNFDIKMKSPDFILPSDDPKNKKALVQSLGETLDGIKKVAETKDLTATCTAFSMPVLGELTRIEFVKFTIFHTKRHTHQLNNIINHLN